jgi:pyruvate/2-oxoglutarate dehydrogenase complex dihydrolipoamide acyltransferase (E2) component
MATIEVPSSVRGTVKDVPRQTGRRIKVGQVVLTVDGRRHGVPPKGGAAKAAAG